MTAYIIDIAIVLILAFFAWRGAKKGLILTLCGLLGLVLAFFGARFVSNTFYEPVANIIEPGIYQNIKELEEQTLGVADPEFTVVTSMDTLVEILRENDLFPDLVDMLESGLGTGGSSPIESLSGQLADTLARVGLFAVSFVVILLLWFLISRMLDLTFKLPILAAINLVGGLLIGLIKALVIVFVLVWAGQLIGWLPADPTTPILSLFTPESIGQLLNRLVK